MTFDSFWLALRAALVAVTKPREVVISPLAPIGWRALDVGGLGNAAAGQEIASKGNNRRMGEMVGGFDIRDECLAHTLDFDPQCYLRSAEGEHASKEGLNKGLAQGRGAWRSFTGHSTG